MVTLMYGKIAAGKTTEAEKIAQKGAVLLSCDELMLTVFTDCLGAKHAETERRCMRYLFKTAQKLDQKRMDSVIDAGFWTREERTEAESFFKAAGIEFKWIKVEAPEEIRKARIKERYEQNEKSRNGEFYERVFAPSPERAAQLDQKFED
ncbi:MAG TPA: ATP-binding protein [Oscillospiraceae bacterium]|nr:ATP-binding protein [Oscillospiraceae bacterium]HPS35066.1 ATP-binding protein [Oscillospiraceae bacterium]